MNPSALHALRAQGIDADDQDEVQTFFVRALYDYDPKDKILLSFKRGDLIEVLSQLESGWWDGLLGENTRGWFPSNYVEIISDAEAEDELRLQAIYEEDGQTTDPGTSSGTGVPRASNGHSALYDPHQQQPALHHQPQSRAHATQPPSSNRARYSDQQQLPSQQHQHQGAFRQSNSGTFNDRARASSSASASSKSQRVLSRSNSTATLSMLTESSGLGSALSLGGGGSSSTSSKLGPASASSVATMHTDTTDKNRVYSHSNPPPPSHAVAASNLSANTPAGRPRAATGLPVTGSRTGSTTTAALEDSVAAPRPSESDFWVPRVTERGEFIYYNTKTGAESYDLPERPEAGDVLSSEEYTTASSRGHGHAGTSSAALRGDNNRSAIAGGVPTAASSSSALTHQGNDVNQGTPSLTDYEQSAISGFSPSAFGFSSEGPGADFGEDGSPWKPRLTENGQIYVVNLETGETRWPTTGFGTELAKGGHITLANIAEAFEMAAHPETTEQMSAAAPLSASNALKSGATQSSSGGKLADGGLDGSRGVKGAPGTATGIAATASASGNVTAPSHATGDSTAAAASSVNAAALGSADIDEGSMEGFLRERYERARHTASATGVRYSRAALLDGAAGAKADDGAPPSMAQDEANALALQRRMEPALADNLEVLRDHALETIDQLAIAVLPNEYASHQRVQGQQLVTAGGNSDAHIQVLLSYIVHAVRELLLASGTLEPSSSDLALLAELSGISGAGSLPERVVAPAKKAGAGSGATSGRQGAFQDIMAAKAASNAQSDIPASLSEAMATLHNTNKAGFSTAPISRHVRDIVALTASQAAIGVPPQELRDLAKRACSTLSKVVFSARAISEDLSHVQSSLRTGSSGTAPSGTGSTREGRSASVSTSDSSQVRAEREQNLRQRVREQAIELAQTIAHLTDECEKAGQTAGTESWVRRVMPVLRSGLGTAGIGMDTLSGGMAAGWRGSGFSLPSALDTAALRAEAMGNYNNPFDLTKDAQIALASGKLAMRRRPANQLSSVLWKDRIEPHVADLQVLLHAFHEAVEPHAQDGKGGDGVVGGVDGADDDDDGVTMTGQSDDGQARADGEPKKSRTASTATTLSLEGVFRQARELLLRLGTVQTLIEDVDFASSLDVDSCSEAINADAAAKELARRAREGLTHFLWHKQDLQDLGCTFMMDLQDGVPTSTLVQTTSSILHTVDALTETLNELVSLAEKQVQSSSTHVGSRARVYGAKDIAPPPTASQVMSAAAAAGGPGAMRAAEAVAVGMGIMGAGQGVTGGAASLLDENQIDSGAEAARASKGAESERAEEDAGVMYLGPGIAVPDGPPAQGRHRADSAARGPSPALSGTTLATNRNRAGSLTNRSVATSSSISERPGGSNASLGGAGSSGASPGGVAGAAGGEDEGDGKVARGTGASSSTAGTIGPIVEEAPWFLEPDYAPGDIVMTPEGQVKGATLGALMERLTTHQAFDSAFNTTFLMTYRSFTTTKEFLDRLIARYRISPPVGLTPTEHELWVSKKQRPIQMRVFNVLKLWLEQHFYEGEDEEFLPHLKEFARGEASNARPNEAQSIQAPLTALLRVLDRRDGAGERSIRTIVHATSAPPPIIPKNAKKVKLLSIEPLEMARQLTLVEFHRYCQIKPAECLGKAWTGPNADVKAKGIKTMIALSNDLTGWVMESILAQADLKTRSAYIKQFILIADRCRTLNNFSTMTAIISALNSAPIHRMKRTWDAVNARTVSILDNLMRMMSSSKNFTGYRDLLHKINPPCVPFLGVWLTDLTFIEDGNPDRLKTDNRLINFNKRQKTADIIREMIIYQSTQYNLTPVPLIQHYLEEVLVPSMNVDLMFEQSEKLEPKEREDERIARLLQESGFL